LFTDTEPSGVTILPIRGLPEITAGADLGTLISAALRAMNLELLAGDIVVVTHKAVAKAEGRLVDLRQIEPSALAVQYAARWGKDPRHIEVVLRESTRIVRMDRGVIIAETKHGLICANAGVDRSNVVGIEEACLLPLDPDASAGNIASTLERATGHRPAVIVSDTFGRAWREGLTNVAIGVNGMRPIRDYVGSLDTQGRPLRVTALAVADELAGAAELVMGKVDGVPVALVRGYALDTGAGSAHELIRKPELDFFR
jgi:coenzyme F420-0:L-glutamate ligase/coenzyme F420-1:gamma-L-glutamate ligase